MNFKFLIFVFLLNHSTFSQHVECDYRMIGAGYSCHLRIFNEHGFDNFTNIIGEHLEGRNDNDVTSIYPLEGSTQNMPRIFCDKFFNLILIDLSSLGIEKLTVESFSGCSDLELLRLWNNNIQELPENTFDNNIKLTYLDLDGNGLQIIPEDIFMNLISLRELELNNNRLEKLPSGIFRTLENLRYLDLSNSHINQLNPLWFENLRNLIQLKLYFNEFPSISEEIFSNLENLETLDISQNKRENGIEFIHDFAFSSLINLKSLTMSNMQLKILNPNWFKNTTNLETVYFNFNQIDHIPPQTFSNLPFLTSLNFWSNNLKVLRRNSFGRSLENLRILDLDSNEVEAIDKEIINDAEGLFTLYFDFNICASRMMGNFLVNREEFMEELEECFRNAEIAHDSFTLENQPFEFSSTSLPGINLKFRSDNEVHLALTPFNFPWTPMIEIIIGADNNTRSIIRRNQETDVVTVPTPGIIRADQWNGFRITWANHAILVWREGEEWPFMGFTMTDFFPVNFYGLRAPHSHASWFILRI